MTFDVLAIGGLNLALKLCYLFRKKSPKTAGPDKQWEKSRDFFRKATFFSSSANMPVTLITKDKPTTWEPDPDPHGYTRFDSLTQFPILHPKGDTEECTNAAKNVVDSNKDIFSNEPAISDIRNNILFAALLAIYDSKHLKWYLRVTRWCLSHGRQQHLRSY